MSDEQDSWFQSAFGLDIGGVTDRIRSEAEQAAGKVQNVVQRVQGAVEGVLDDVVETVTDVAKKVAGAAGVGGAGSGGGGGGAGGGSPKTAAPAGGGTGSFPLSGSVGRGGRNASGDVKAIQQALGIGVDGDCGSKTIAAIEAFQRSIGQAKPDGRIDAGGPTERALGGGGKSKPEKVNMPGEDDSGSLLDKALDGVQGLVEGPAGVVGGGLGGALGGGLVGGGLAGGGLLGGVAGGVAGQLLQDAGDLLGKASPLADISLGGGGLRLTLNNLSPEQIETAQQFLRAHNLEARATRGPGGSDDDYEPFLNGRSTSLPEVIVALKSAIPPLPLQDPTEGLRDLVNERFRQLVKQGKERAFEQLFLNPNRVPNAPVDVSREEATKALTKFLERVLKAQGGKDLRITDPVRAAGQALGRGLPGADSKITLFLTKKGLPGRPAELAGAITRLLPERIPQANVEALDGIPVKDTAAKPQSLVEVLGDALAKEVEGLIKVLPKAVQDKVREAVKESVEKAILTAVKQAMSESNLEKGAQERIEKIVEGAIKQKAK
jgi:hypothetical protein